MGRVMWEKMNRLKPVGMTVEEYEQDLEVRLKQGLY